MSCTVVINSAVWLGALAYYFIDAHKWFIGPKITIDAEDLDEEQKEAIKEEGLVVNRLEKEVEAGMSGDGGSGSGSGSVDEVKKL